MKAPVCVCSISLSVSTGHAGTSVTVKGAHFVVGGSVGIRFVDSKGVRRRVAKPQNVKVASNGTFSVKITVPTSAAIGDGRLVAKETTHARRAVAKFKVT